MGSNNAATEIIGVMLLLGISVSLFSVVYFTVLTTDLQEDAPSLFIVGSIDENNNLVKWNQTLKNHKFEHNYNHKISSSYENYWLNRIVKDKNSGEKKTKLIEEVKKLFIIASFDEVEKAIDSYSNTCEFDYVNDFSKVFNS